MMKEQQQQQQQQQQQRNTAMSRQRLVLVASVVLLSLVASVEATSTQKNNKLLRSRSSQQQTSWFPRWLSRKLHPPPHHHHHHSSGGSGYTGCLGYSDDELQSKWIFKGNAPDCNYTSDGGSGSGGSSGGGSSGGSGGSSGGSGSGGSDSGSGGSDSGSGGNGSGGSGSGGDGSGGDDSGGDGSGSGGSGGDGSVGGDGSGGDESDGNGGGDGGGNENDDYNDNDNYYNDDGGGGNGGDDAYGDDDPVSNFDVAQCDTYGSLWLWDLSLSCEDQSSLENCECTFAEELMDAGMLSCDDVSKCPNNCAVCLTCMRILGCSTGSAPAGAGAATTYGVSNVAFYLIAAAIGTVAISGVAYAAYRKKPDDDSLGAHLVDGQSTISSLDGAEPIVFLAPSIPADDDGMYDAPPVQFEAAALAAAASQDAADTEPFLDGDVWLAPVTPAGLDGEDEEEKDTRL